MTNTINVERYAAATAVKAQEKYCEEKGLPMFVPANGVCYRCGRNVFQGDRAYSVPEAGWALITGCPYCNVSFCD